MTEVGQRLVRAAKEAAAIARGEKKAARIHVPPDVDVRALRTKLNLKQEEFAAEFGFTLNQIRDWEQGRSRPLDGMRAYLIIIGKWPDKVRSMLKQALVAKSPKASKVA